MQRLIIDSDKKKIYFHFDEKMSEQEVENINKVLSVLFPENIIKAKHPLRKNCKVFVFTKCSQNFISIFGGEYSLNDYHYYNESLSYEDE